MWCIIENPVPRFECAENEAVEKFLLLITGNLVNAIIRPALFSLSLTVVSLDKVVEVIRYFSSSIKVTSLYKVKLMKKIQKKQQKKMVNVKRRLSDKIIDTLIEKE